ncbi:MAG TPA: hypothetical protein DCG21_05485 [Gammaproteobacteria bacterium]|nr:hypothetical protein [Gammaproteobacteria bacterium]
MISRKFLGLLMFFGVGAYASGTGESTFAPFFTEADWAVTEVNDPTGLAPVGVVQRFEVRPGQCISKPPFHDCERGVERAELGQAMVPAASPDAHWYRWQVFFPRDYETTYPARNRHGQFVDHGTGDSAWAFEIGSTGALWVGSQFDDESRYFSVINDRNLRGEWHDVMVEAVWSREKGRLNVWVNGQERVRYRGATCDRCRIALTYGIARHGVSKFKERYPEKTLPVQITYYLAAEAYPEDPGWIVTPPPPEPEEVTDDNKADQETAPEPESDESESVEEEGGHQEASMEGSMVSEQPEDDSSGTIPAQEDDALDEVTIAPAIESDSATASQTIEASDSASTPDGTDQPTQTPEVSAEDETVEETVSAEAEERDSASGEGESTSLGEAEDISTEDSQKPLSSDTDDRR